MDSVSCLMDRTSLLNINKGMIHLYAKWRDTVLVSTNISENRGSGIDYTSYKEISWYIQFTESKLPFYSKNTLKLFFF